MAAVQRQRAAHHLIVIMAASRATNHFACMWQPGCYTRASWCKNCRMTLVGQSTLEQVWIISLAKVAVYIVE